jgi:hypothetical protein
VVTTVPARPAAGEEFVVRVELFDGATGRPVDDLAVHHEAMAHLVVTSEDGRYFRHVHPLRTAPGRLEVRLRADRPGRYLTYVELERTDSGGQLLTGAFAVTGPVKPTATSGQAAASSQAATSGQAAGDATAGAVTVTPAAPQAGRATTVEVATAGTPRPWLGMAGHLIVRGADGEFLGHVHEMGTPGSRLRFTFSFPSPGRYLAWAQYATERGITTVPFTVEVPR